MTGGSGHRRPAGDRVVVVGGGLAGISAALCLADAGRAVTLVESRPRLGGAAFSFRRDSPVGPLSVDNGQHVFLRCCAAYQWLLDRLGATDLVTVQPHLDIPVLRPDGRRGRIGRLPGVPAPAHLSAALLGYRLLSPADRLRAARGALALRALDPADPTLDGQSLGRYLRAHGQNDATIAALWGIVAVATLNLAPDDASLALAAKVFRTGLLDHAPAADIGYAAVPLGRIHHDAALAALSRAGVEVALAHRVEKVGAGSVVAHHRDTTRTWDAEDVVLALPHRDALGVAPDLTGGPVARAAGLGATPIVNIHVVYDRPVTDLPFAAGVESAVQWVFDRTSHAGLSDGSQYLAVTVSAADGIVEQPSRPLVARFRQELEALFPAARQAAVRDAFVTRERRATFRQAPGTAALRPGTESGTPGLWLAGSWTDTGWPDTMESAVRSGCAAAAGVLGRPAGWTGWELAA